MYFKALKLLIFQSGNVFLNPNVNVAAKWWIEKASAHLLMVISPQ